MLHVNLGKTLIIVNPQAQSGAAAQAAARLQRFLELCMHERAFDVAHTQAPRHACELAAQASGYRTVLALGGDGVIHEVVNGLMRIDADRRPTLGVVPVGSGNDFARTIGLTDCSGDDFSHLLASEPQAIDVMRVDWRRGVGEKDGTNPRTSESARGTEYVIETFSMGLDAAIGLGTHDLRYSTGLTGAALYTASGLRTFGRGYRSFKSHASFDGGAAAELTTITFAIQNGPTYGSGFQICPDADPTDGLLDICYAKGPAPRALAVPVFLSAKNGKHVHSKHIHMQRARRIELELAEDGYPIQVDGELLEARSLTIEVEPGALTVLKPAGARR